MKNLLLVTCLILTVLASTAQIRRTVKPQPVTDSLAAPAMGNDKVGRKEALQQLDLSKEQKKKLKAAAQASKAEKQAIEADTSLTAEQRKQAMRQLVQRRKADMDTLLTPEQRQKAMRMRREALQQRKARKASNAEAGEATKEQQ
jgi:Spy/CpxP family protein refolding chaperone